MSLKWLDRRLSSFLPAITQLGLADEVQIQELVEAEIDAWRARPSIKEERSLRNPMYEARRALEQLPLTPDNTWHNPRYDRHEHIALKYMDFSPQEWTAFNVSTSSQLENRLQHSKFLDDPDAIVERAGRLLDSDSWADMVAGLVVNTGRRHTELMKTASFAPKTDYSVVFSGQLKSAGNEQVSFEIPTFSRAERVNSTLERLRSQLDCTGLSRTQVNQRFSGAVIKAVDRHFSELVPQREGKDNLYTHLFRAVYARLAVWFYCPPKVADIFFMASVQGHFRFLDSDSEEYRLNFASTAHYYDYQIGDHLIRLAGGQRQGIWLDKPGVQVLEVLQSRDVEDGMDNDHLLVVGDRSSGDHLPVADGSGQLSLLSSESEVDLGNKARGMLCSDGYTVLLAGLMAVTGCSPGALIKSGSFSRSKEDDSFVWLAPPLGKRKDKVVTLVSAEVVVEAITRLREHPDVQRLRYLSPNDILVQCRPHLNRMIRRYFRLSDIPELFRVYSEQVSRLVEQAAEKAIASPSDLTVMDGAIAPPSTVVRSGERRKERKRQSVIFHVWEDDRSRLEAISSRFDTSSQADTMAQVLGLADISLRLAERLAVEPDTLEAKVDSLLEPSVIERDSVDLDGLQVAISSLSHRLTAVEAQLATSVFKSVKSSKQPSGKKPVRGRRPSAEAKIERAVQAVMEYNELCSDKDLKWAINASAIFRLTGCNRPAVRRYFASHQDIVDKHNQLHDLSERHNTSKGRKGIQIENVISF